MKKHTPGPWTYYAGGRGAIYGADETAVCLLCGPSRLKTDESEARKDANASLIAAAPKLLRVLEEIMSLNPDQFLPMGLPEAAREAIEDAGGEL